MSESKLEECFWCGKEFPIDQMHLRWIDAGGYAKDVHACNECERELETQEAAQRSAEGGR